MEELQLKSYAISCCVGADDRQDDPIAPNQLWDNRHEASSVSSVSTMSGSNLTSEWMTARTSLVSSSNTWHDSLSTSAVQDINKQEIDLEAAFSSILNSNDEEIEEEDEEDDEEEMEEEETSDDDQPYEM